MQVSIAGGCASFKCNQSPRLRPTMFFAVAVRAEVLFVDRSLTIDSKALTDPNGRWMQ